MMRVATDILEHVLLPYLGLKSLLTANCIDARFHKLCKAKLQTIRAIIHKIQCDPRLSDVADLAHLTSLPRKRELLESVVVSGARFMHEHVKRCLLADTNLYDERVQALHQFTQLEPVKHQNAREFMRQIEYLFWHTRFPRLWLHLPSPLNIAGTQIPLAIQQRTTRHSVVYSFYMSTHGAAFPQDLIAVVNAKGKIFPFTNARFADLLSTCDLFAAAKENARCPVCLDTKPSGSMFCIDCSVNELFDYLVENCYAAT
jgi:hypothetical protein